MHTSSFEKMRELIDRFFPGSHPTFKVLDIGAMDVNGSYKTIFTAKGMIYSGLDVAEGPNIDIVCQDPYHFPLANNTYDIIVSGQAFEHIEFYWITMLEIARVLKVGGTAIVIAPGSGPEHRYPVDCWRFYPDGMQALARWADLTCLETSANWPQIQQFDWGDTYGVFRKTRNSNAAIGRAIALLSKALE